MTSMRGKKKLKKFRAVTAVKALARERIGEPRPVSVVPDRKKTSEKKASEKHKKTLVQLLQED